MNNYIEKLNIEDSFLTGTKEIELFKCIHESSILEICHDVPRFITSKKAGAAMRVNNGRQKTGLLYSSPKLEINEDWFATANVNNIPYYSLPFMKTPVEREFPNISIESSDWILDNIESCKPRLRERDLTIEKLAIEEDFAIYQLANTNGIHGVGYRYLFSINCVLTSKNGNEYELSKVFDLTDKNMAISIFFDSINCFERSLKKIRSEIKIPRLLLSTNAAMEVFYLFLFFFNDQAIAQFSPEKINDLIKRNISISHVLDIVENSEYNKIVGGNIDGEGTPRISTFIFKNGSFKNLISKFSTGENNTCSASAYRFDYSILPQTKASKIYVKPGSLSEEELISAYDIIGKVDSFQGMYESFDRGSFDFTALLRVKVFRYGECLGYHTKKVRLNLIEILSKITAVSNNLNYSGDGTFYIPSMICEIEL